jgi:hypothetical protein
MTMRRLLPLTGIGFVAMIVLAVLLAAGTPATTASGAKVATYYDSHQARMVAISFVFMAAALLFVIFASTLGRVLSPTEDRSRSIWGQVLFGGAVLFAAAAGVVAALNFALADSPTKISEPALQALNLFLGDSWAFWNGALGVFMLGAAGAWLGSTLGVRWLGWVALVLGLALFIPFADFFAFLASGLWIVGASIVLFNRTGERGYAAAPSIA